MIIPLREFIYHVLQLQCLWYKSVWNSLSASLQNIHTLDSDPSSRLFSLQFFAHWKVAALSKEEAFHKPRQTIPVTIDYFYIYVYVRVYNFYKYVLCVCEWCVLVH